jgi:hypothetical protein
MITTKHIDILHHTLGLTPERREPFRNHYVAGAGHHSQPELLELEAAGFMTKSPAPRFCDPGDIVFRVTDAGRAFALDNLPQPPKRSRYEQFMRDDCGLSFAEWLGIELPRRQNSYDYRTPSHFRLVSSRATGDYATTMKAAKASYKAALATRRANEKAWKEGISC